MKIVPKKIISLLLSLAVALSFASSPAFMHTSSAFTTGNEAMVVCNYFPYSYDFRGSGLGAECWGQIPNLSADNRVAYCIDSTASSGDGGNTSTFEVDSVEGKSTLYSLALSYGYTGTTKYGYSDDVEQLATQILIWNISHSDRGWWNNSSSVTGLESSVLDRYTAGMWDIGSDVKTVYGKIKEKVVGYSSLTPSFSSSTTEREMTYNKTTGVWTLSLTDSNRVLKDFDWDEAVKSYSYLSVSISSNTITFTSTKEFTTKTLTANYTDNKYSPKNAVLLRPLSGLNKQRCVTTETATCKSATVKLFAEKSEGDLKIKKTSEDNKVSGITFTVKKSGSSSSKNYTTNTDGEILISDLEAGDYVVTETKKAGYTKLDSKTVTVTAGNTATVSFSNTLERGNLTVTKNFYYNNGSTSKNVTNNMAQSVINGVKFRLSGTSTAGQKVDKTLGLTLKNGSYVVEFTNIPVGTYDLSETLSGTAAKVLVTPATSKVTITADETTSKTVDNNLKTGDYSVTKSFIYKNDAGNHNVTSQITNTVISGIKFNLSGTSTSGLSVDVTKGLTLKNGKYVAEFSDIPIGTYTIKEQLSGTAATVLIAQPNESATITYNYSAGSSIQNELKTGNLIFRKDVEYGTVNTIQFTLSGESTSGVSINITADVSDKTTTQVFPWMGTVDGVKINGTSKVTVTNGTVKFEDVPIGTYSLTESRANDCYIKMQAKNIQILADETVDINGTANGNGVIVNELKRGGLKITKKSENGKIEGIRFRLRGQSQSGENVLLEAVTNAQGIAEFSEVPIGQHYTLSEVNADAYFIPNPDITNIRIDWDTVNNISVPNKVTVNNWNKRGNLIVTKTIENSKYPENNTLAGYTFRLHGTSDSNETVDLKAVTDKNGIATFENVLIGTYTLEEINTPIRYVVPKPQSVNVFWNGKDHNNNIINPAQAQIPPAAASFENRLKYFSVEVVKQDSEVRIPQGESVLYGAVYGIYDGDVLVDTYVTDVNGHFKTKEYECGYNWTVKEITPSEGYMLDNTTYKVGAAPDLYTIRNNKAPSITSPEDVKKGSFLVLKTTGNGTGVYEFEVGAEFEVYLTVAGSYENAHEYERDYLVIGANGTATTKDLPYGNYTIHQTKAWDGRQFADDYTLFVGKENGSYTMVPINNGRFESRIKVVKVDGDVAEGEEPKVIPYAGAAFQIYDPTGKLVVQKITYPTYMEFDTFYTNADGEFTTPEPLDYGIGYSLVEIEAPYGYTLSKKPLYFNVTALDADLDNGYATIMIDFPNNPQMGTVKVDKVGEVFSTVVNENGVYQPQFAEKHLQGAVYSIIAAEDIITPDGTLRYARGEEVDRITTGSDGSITSKPLYLGKYNVIEVQTPYGMVIDDTPIPVELVYEDQTIEIKDAVPVTQNNDRQKLALSLHKVMETDDLFSLGMNNEILSVSFGLYAAEDITADDGSVLPKNGLIETKLCNSNGVIAFDSDLPFGRYYVKEISTEEHYILNEEVFEFTFEYKGQDMDIVEISVNGGEAIENKLVYGMVGGTKVDADTGKGLSGAVIGLFAKDVDKFTADTVYKTTVTDENGKFSFVNIPYGSYIVKEIAPPDKYVLSEEAFDVVITEDGEEIEVTIENTIIRGDIQLVKVDADDQGEHLSGAEFSIWHDVNENYIIDDEDVLIGTMDDVQGTYTYNNLDYGKYLVRETKAPDEYIIDEGVYSVFIEENGKVYTITNNGYDTFTNKHIPEIGTTATVESDKSTVSGGEITINDTVTYEHLYVGKEYTITGVLMDKATGKPFLVNGEEVINSVTFVPETHNGEVTVTFTFDTTDITEDTDLVVFERLNEGDVEVAVHTDIKDEDQTVTIHKPDMHTTATSNGEKEDFLTSKVTITDVVDYKNFVAGKEYTVSGVLMDKSTGKELLIDGKTVTAEATFTAETKNGSVKVVFEFDASEIAEDTTLVVFETMSDDGREFLVHADIDDEDQTVTLKKPEIKTNATSNGTHQEFMKGEVTIRDDITYNNLIAGKEYTVNGVLMDKSTGKELLVNGKTVIAKTTFVAESEDGIVSVFFKFDASALTKQTSVVAFERLEYNNAEIAVHADIEDEDQTVTFVEPSIGTKLAFNEGEMDKLQQMVLDDVVYFHNLVAGREYKLYGTLRDKNGYIYLDCDGKEARSELTFVPETSDGKVTVQFLLNSSTLDDELDWFVVAFEELYYNGIKIASHEDMTAKDQTVELFQFPDNDIPHGDFPNTGIQIKYSGVILAAITTSTAIIITVNKRRKRRK